ncbi:MAG: hypothetical protein K2X91_19115, partial [Thermoleophilia bacterium]|nr:hypothetical protein [Thermoleophilia bacterium]
ATEMVIVESRHLDTDARERGRHEVDAPSTPDQARARLVDLVRGLHPEAVHRSYADGAATFLAPDHLIVAFYERRGSALEARRAPALNGRGTQHRLFHS